MVATKIIWYIILLVLSTGYVFLNFRDLEKYNFFDIINVDTILFIVWVILLLFPFVSGFEGFGFKVKVSDEDIYDEVEDVSDKMIHDTSKPESLSVDDILTDFTKISTQRNDKNE